jgi:hypothetical protein
LLGGAMFLLALIPLAVCLVSGSSYRVVLKNGTVLEGDVHGTQHGVIELVTGEGEELSLPRTHVRALEGRGELADAPIFWRRAPKPEADAPSAFTRISRDEQGGALETPVLAYEQADTGRRVYLVGAVHIGHTEYYRALQDILDSMDLVLWEGVGAKEKPTEDAAARFDVIFRAQVMMRRVLNLEGQLESMDYVRPFWRNCDVSINELQAQLDERGLEMIPNEGLVRLLFGTLFTFIDPETIPRSELIGKTYRAMLAPILGSIDDPESIFAKLDQGGMKDVIIDFRNDHVVQALAAELLKPGPSRIAIFYGAGHFRGLDAALRDQLKLRYFGTHWVKAWRF